jgi:hypothetical protein
MNACTGRFSPCRRPSPYRSCNACLRAWNGNGSWLDWYWRTYMGERRSPSWQPKGPAATAADPQEH